MATPILLNESDALASGVERRVYLHPHDDTKVLKVLRPQNEQPKRFTFRDITTRLMPAVRLRLIRKEYNEFTRIRITYPTVRLPVTALFGFAQTSLGLACVAERVQGLDTPLGPTLTNKINGDTFTQSDLAALNVTVTQFYDLGIRAGDLKPHNLVFGRRDAGYECVLVDGFGDIMRFRCGHVAARPMHWG